MMFSLYKYNEINTFFHKKESRIKSIKCMNLVTLSEDIQKTYQKSERVLKYRHNY